MKDTKRVFCFHAMWECEKESERLTEYSENGWHAEKLHLSGATLRRDENARYVYALDRRSGDVGEQYLDSLRERGWQYVDGCNDCRLFRKAWDAGADPEDTVIPSDEKSRYDAVRREVTRFGRLAAIYAVFTLLGVIRAFLEPTAARIAAAVVMLVCSALLGLAMLSFSNRVKGAAPRLSGRTLTTLLVAAVIAALLPGQLESSIAHGKYTFAELPGYESTASESDEPWSDSLDFRLKKGGECVIDVDLECGAGRLALDLVDDEGDLYYRIDPCAAWDKAETVELPAGSYHAVCYSGGSENAENATLEISVRPKKWYDLCA